jgi:cell wall-associated NlpC family hydrolase
MFYRRDIVLAARQYLGCPFHWQGRSKAYGVDCAGLVFGVMAALGLPYEDDPTYDRQYPPKIFDILDKSLHRESNPPRDGDVVLFWIGKPDRPKHLGIKSDVGLIHTNTTVRKVVETSMPQKWNDRIFRVYRMPGLLED